MRNETIKWTAAANFARFWDIEAEDFLSMWRKCTRKAFLDTPHSHPTQGITTLLKNPDEAENVREAFRRLFIADDGNLEDRWDRILAFIEDINGRIKRLYPNSKMYLQTKEGTLSYLNLWDPDHNYRYKPQPANSWASYIGYGDWTTGQRFSLCKYYKMCDEIHEVVKDHEELLCVHRQRFENGEPDCDRELHILTFDVLYCFWGYDDARQEAMKEYQEAVAQQHIEELQDRISELDSRIQENEEGIQDVVVIGSSVKHKKWGSGVVCEGSETSITVEFAADGRKKFQWPGAFLNGFLQPDDQGISEVLKRNQELEQENSILWEERKQVEKELADTERVYDERENQHYRIRESDNRSTTEGHSSEHESR